MRFQMIVIPCDQNRSCMIQSGQQIIHFLSAPAALAADQTDPLRSITDLPVAYSHDQ